MSLLAWPIGEHADNAKILESDDELDAIGVSGWELVLYDPALRGSGVDKGTYYFKRPK